MALLSTAPMRSSALRKIEINCDMGEGFGRWKMAPDDELMALVDVANIACGFHAGDPSLMRKTVSLAKLKKVRVGAHPGLQDLVGFGRRRMEIDPEDLYSMVLYQIGALKAFLDAEGMPMNHVKPHGELYFYMQRDPAIMEAVIRATAVYGVPMYGAKSEVQKSMCAKYGLSFIEEAYVDLQYSKEAKLLSVAQSNVATPQDIYTRAFSIATNDNIIDKEGNLVTIGFKGQPFSFCIHSDMPTAFENTKACRKAVDEVNSKLGWS
ncbi:unnamed protein product [Clonostachys chloroleuca]|uniref:Lactam utilization protein lamB n=1 Tax=Clonostachys chloroleuca TaxID=1926264 RepID=A0AA35LR51_9HYPO|nr:unnamed protein product [Clonostachys chloroleuca]